MEKQPKTISAQVVVRKRVANYGEIYASECEYCAEALRTKSSRIIETSPSL